MDCNTARFLWHFVRPGLPELEGADARDVNQHLQECGECSSWARAEGLTEEALAHAMSRVPVPTGLRERIGQRLAEQRKANRRRSLAACLTAAVVLAVLFGSWAWLANRPALVDLEPFLWVKSAAAPADVEAFFQSQGVTMSAPTQFRYELLEGFDLANFNGKNVPRLLFVERGPTGGRPILAQVYVLSADQFDLSSLDQGVVPTSGHTIQVLKSSSDDLRYLVIFTGTSLDPFTQGGAN